MNIFLKYHKELYNLSEESISILKSEVEVINVPKKEIVISEGDICRHIYFVESGLIRSYFNADSREITMGFYLEGEIAVVPYDWQKSSPLTVVAIEDTVLLRISENRLNELFAKSTELAHWGYKFIKLTLSNAMLESMVGLEFKRGEMYQLLLAKHPEILQRIPLKDIASWFNITTSSLSRIRAKIRP